MKAIYLILPIYCLISCKQSSSSTEQITKEVIETEQTVTVEEIPKDWFALTELIDNKKNTRAEAPQKEYKEVIFNPCHETNQEFHFKKEKNEWKLILYIGQEAVTYKVLNLKMKKSNLLITVHYNDSSDPKSETIFTLEDYKLNKGKVRWKESTSDTNTNFITKSELQNFEIVDEQCEDDF